MTTKLNSASKQLLSTASPGAIAKACRNLERYTEKSRWLGTNNYFSSGLKNKLRKLHESGGRPIDSVKRKHLSELIAASSLLHCSDGWVVLGKAVCSLLQGDPDTCRHLGYYAELRAAVALLATAGIGVFDRHHFVVTNTEVIPLGQSLPTHQAIWLILEHFAAGPSGPNLLSRVVQPSGAPLQAWIDVFPHHANWQQQGNLWFRTLGLDLRRLAEDRNARNTASYQPTRLVYRDHLEARKAASFSRELWRSIEPVGHDPFEHLDRHLLRKSLAEHYRQATNRSAADDPSRFAIAVEAAVANVVGSHELQKRLSKFLTDTDPSKDSVLVARALRRDKPSSAEHHLEVLARGAILLRLATGSVRDLLSGSGLSLDKLEFWWKNLGTELGLWDEPPGQQELVDVWADVSDAITEIEDWEEGDRSSYSSLAEECGTSINVLSRCGLAVMWELAQ